MNWKQSITDTAKNLIGDSNYALLRHYNIARTGLQQYSHEFSATEGHNRNLLTCCPNYGNLGDHAIALAEKRLLRQTNGPTLAFSGDTTSLLLCIQKYVTSNDTIFLTGGGNMGTLYRNEEEYRLRIISAAHKCRVVLFPQTISYGNTEDDHRFLLHTQHIYGKHPNLHLFARESVSFERMKKAYPDNDVQLVPDVVLSVSGEDTADFSARKGVLLCMRNDIEQRVESDSRHHFEELANSLNMNWKYTDTTIQNDGPVSQGDGERLVHEKWDEFRSARLVITDRLHGMIFAAITGTPCVALNNSNGKVGFEYQWLKNIPYLAFANTASSVPGLARQVLEVANPRFPSDQFVSDFSPLTKLIGIDKTNG